MWADRVSNLGPLDYESDALCGLATKGLSIMIHYYQSTFNNILAIKDTDPNLQSTKSCGFSHRALLTLKVPNKNCSRRHFNFLL